MPKIRARVNRRPVLAGLLAVAGAVLLGFYLVASRAAAPSIVDYMKKPGGREVVVPCGTYTAGTVSAPHNDWLILKAASPGCVSVDMSTHLIIDEATSKVAFVGFKFIGREKGNLQIRGEDIVLWYADISRPDYGWQNGDGRKVVMDIGHAGVNDPPIMGERVKLAGCEIHDGISTALFVKATDGVVVEGCRFFNIAEPAADESQNECPNPKPADCDEIHVDVPSLVASKNFTWRNNYVEKTAYGRFFAVPRWRHIENLVIENSWSNVPMNAFQFVVGETQISSKPDLHIFGRRSSLYSWGRTQPERLDIESGRSVPHNSSEFIEVIDTNIIQTPPPAGALDPATAWRAAHSYNSYRQYIGLEGTTPPPPPAKQGDINGDGNVNASDLSILLSKWGTSDSKADINSSGKVDAADLSVLLGRWGS